MSQSDTTPPLSLELGGVDEERGARAVAPIGSTSPVSHNLHDYTAQRMSALGVDSSISVEPEIPLFAAKALDGWRGLTGQLQTNAGGEASRGGAVPDSLTTSLRTSMRRSPTSSSAVPRLLLGQDSQEVSQSAKVHSQVPPEQPTQSDSPADDMHGNQNAWTAGGFAMPGMPEQTIMYNSTTESCVVLLTMIALGCVLLYVQTVLVPLIMAIFVASMLVPVVDALTDRPLRIFNHTWCRPWCEPVLKMEKRYPNILCNLFASIFTLRLPNILALLLVIILFFFFTVACGIAMYRSVEEFVSHVPGYEHNIEEMGKDLISAFTTQTPHPEAHAFPVGEETDTAEQYSDSAEQYALYYKDSAEQYTQGITVSQGGSLALGGPNITVGIRFPHIKLARDKQITQAFVLFDIDDVSPETRLDLNVTIQGEVTRSDAFQVCCTDLTALPTDNAFGLRNRKKTESTVNWGVEPAKRTHGSLVTADITTIINEVITAPGWHSEYTNPLTLFFSHYSGDGVRHVEKITPRDGDSDPMWPPENLLHDSVIRTNGLPSKVNTPVLMVIYETSTLSTVMDSYMSTHDQEQELSSLLDSLTNSGILGPAAIQLLENVVETLGKTSLVMLYTVFILLGRQERKQRKQRKVSYAVEHRLKVYISWKLLISAGTGFSVGLSLYCLNCDLYALFGILTFGLNFIPTVGLLLAVLLPLPVVIFAPYCAEQGSCPAGFGMGTYEKIFAIVIPYCIQLVVANFIEPVILGKRLNLHPVIVLLALVFWYMMWGVAGAFLSVPIMSVIKIFCQNMDNATAQWLGQALEGNLEGGDRQVDKFRRSFEMPNSQPGIFDENITIPGSGIYYRASEGEDSI